MKIPTGPETLTADWLIVALREGHVINKEKVVSFQAGPLAENQGFYGQISRLTLAYDVAETDAPRSLIAKFSSATPEMRQRAISSYEREVGFYRHLAHQTTLPTPTCYYGDIDLDTGWHILLLEDLAPARSGSRVAGCSPDQAALAVHQIAKFHVGWWEAPELAAIPWLPDTSATFDYDGLEARHNQWWPDFYGQAKHRLPKLIKNLGEGLGQHRGDIMRHLFNTPPRTLTHADYQLDNLIFGTPEGGIPFAVVDWQFIRRGRGVWDVAYFLSQNLAPEDRRAVEIDLLTAYHQILVDNGVQGFSFEQCLHDYRLSLLHRFGALISTIAAMPFSREQRQMHIDILLPRNIAAIIDHKADQLL